MAVYVYSSDKSSGAQELCKILGAERLRNFDGLDFWRRGKRVQFSPEDVVICWGLPIDTDNVTVINGGIRMNKMDELLKLSNLGLPAPLPAKWDPHNNGKVPYNYAARVLNATSGTDLLFPSDLSVDFVVPKVSIEEEFRIHSFNGRSIKAGKKVPRDGFSVVASESAWRTAFREGLPVAHPWVRSFEGGWKVDYTQNPSNRTVKGFANKAVAGLGLTFGTVDVGVDHAGSWRIFGVHRTPEPDPSNIELYARRLTALISKGEVEESEV